MEAFAAISLVGTIIQFIDVGGKILSTTKEIRKSSSGMISQNESLQESAQYVQQLSTSMKLPSGAKLDSDQQELRRLAKECCEISDQIHELIRSILPARRTSRSRLITATIFSAVRLYANEKPIRELEEKLHSCRILLQLQYSKVSSKETQKQISTLAQNTTNGDQKLFDLQRQIADLQRGAAVSSLSSSAQQQIQTLLSMSQNARDQVIQVHIRKSLEFPEMNERSEVIEQAHRDTYGWLLQDKQPTDIAPIKLDARQKYNDWLLSGKGIFHIAGKPGSGKSTLMKLLSEHSSTRNMLSKWAGKHKLILVKFFFWKPASSRLPRSIPGMKRSILHDILKQFPELCSIAFPKKWSELLSTESPWGYDCSFNGAEIQDGFENLLRQSNLKDTYRLCFFVDALDELEVTHQQGHRDLLDLLESWIRVASDALRICVSSREDNIFMDKLKSAQGIRLQDLTRNDMMRYCRDRVRDFEKSEDGESIAQKIVDRSEGVFLWVALVTNDVCQLHADGGDFSALEEELDALPNELNAVYKHLLTRISGVQTKRAYQLLAMALQWSNCTSKMSLLAVIEMENFARDHHYVFKGTRFNDTQTLDSIGEEAFFRRHADRLVKAQRLVQGWCKGLVEVRSLSRSRMENLPPQDHYQYVTFVHRSVVEFLLQADTSATMAEHTAHIDIVETISQLHLAVFKSLPACLLDWNTWTGIFAAIICMRGRTDAEHMPYTYLEQLESVLPSKFPRHFEELSSLPIDEQRRSSNQAAYIIGANAANLLRAISWALGAYPLLPHDIIVKRPLHLAAFAGSIDYVQWKLLHAPEILRDPWTASLLCCCLLTCDRPVLDVTKFVSCFSAILSNGALESFHAFAYMLFLQNCLRMTNSERADIREIADGYIVLFLKHITDYNNRTQQATVHPFTQPSNSERLWSWNRSRNTGKTASSPNPWLDERRLILPDKPESSAISLREFVAPRICSYNLRFIDAGAKSTIYTTLDDGVGRAQYIARKKAYVKYNQDHERYLFQVKSRDYESSRLDGKGAFTPEAHRDDNAVSPKATVFSAQHCPRSWQERSNWLGLIVGSFIVILLGSLASRF